MRVCVRRLSRYPTTEGIIGMDGVPSSLSTDSADFHRFLPAHHGEMFTTITRIFGRPCRKMFLRNLCPGTPWTKKLPSCGPYGWGYMVLSQNTCYFRSTSGCRAKSAVQARAAKSGWDGFPGTLGWMYCQALWKRAGYYRADFGDHLAGASGNFSGRTAKSTA